MYIGLTDTGGRRYPTQPIHRSKRHADKGLPHLAERWTELAPKVRVLIHHGVVYEATAHEATAFHWPKPQVEQRCPMPASSSRRAFSWTDLGTLRS